MIRYKLSCLYGQVIVSIDSSDSSPHKSADIEFEYIGFEDIELKDEKIGEFAIQEVSTWLARQYGAFGHIIGTKTTPVDLDAALKKDPKYKPELLEGEPLVASYKFAELPPGAVT